MSCAVYTRTWTWWTRTPTYSSDWGSDVYRRRHTHTRKIDVTTKYEQLKQAATTFLKNSVEALQKHTIIKCDEIGRKKFKRCGGRVGTRGSSQPSTRKRRKNNIKNAASALVISLLSEQQIERTPALIRCVYLAGMLGCVLRPCTRIRSAPQHNDITNWLQLISIQMLWVEKENEWALFVSLRKIMCARCVAIARFLLHGSLNFSAHSFELFRVRRLTCTVVFLFHLTPIDGWTLLFVLFRLLAVWLTATRSLFCQHARHVPCIPIAF